jgi:diaminopimelate decarboxylase
MPDPALLADAGLERRDGALHLEGVGLEEIAAAIGTPAWVYNAEAIRRRYRALAGALAPLRPKLHFAVKANSNLAVLRVLRDLGAGADIVSGGELARGLAAGFAAADIVFSGVGKREDELAAALGAGVGHVNVESLDELERLAAVAARLRRLAVIGIRVNPDVTTDTHPYIATSSGGIKFGIPADRVAEAARFAAGHPWLELRVLAVHLGSQLADPAPFAEAADRLLALLAEVRALGIGTVRALDVGGGLGIAYRGGDGIDLPGYAAALVPRLAPAGLETYVEPGRFLVGSAGVLVTEVLYRKHSGGRDFVIVDAAMNDLLRPSLYRAHHGIVEVRAAGRPKRPVDVVGPVCETGDFLALDRSLPDVAPGERLAVLGTGAYGFVMSSNYNTRPRGPEVLVDSGRWAVVRPRERVDDLFASETAEPFA